mgnify:CR=1 FL=1
MGLLRNLRDRYGDSAEAEVAIRESEMRTAAILSSAADPIVIIDNDGRIVATYDKVHLVPLGEYIPFHRQLAPVSGLVGRGSFEEGTGPATLALPGLPAVAPMICYEVIFPGAVIDRDDRPQWLLNLTNDAWYGRSAGPYQHFAAARMRAVEEGLPLVRSAQNGISGVIDPYGRVTKRLDLDAVGVVDADLPVALPSTFYTQWRDLPAALLALIFVTLAFPFNGPRKSRGN